MPLRLIPEQTSIDFIARKWQAFALTGLLLVMSLGAFFAKGLNLGIDFTGGVVVEIRCEQAVDLSVVRAALGKLPLGEVSLQNTEHPGDVLIRLQPQPGTDQAVAIAGVKEALERELGDTLEYRKVDYVGPQVGGELAQAGILASILAFLAIMVYVWFRFEWVFGLGAVLALVHDALLTIGFYAVTQLEFNLTSIAAILTIVGYSINDSVVIYDRIRENLRKYKKMPIGELLNLSINETLSRTILTGGTTLLAVLALALLGGEVLASFSWAVLFGVIVGTYSSIYVSATVLDFMRLRRDAFGEAGAA